MAADLQNQEPIVIQVNAFSLEQLGHFREAALLVINIVVRVVVAGGCATDSEI